MARFSVVVRASALILIVGLAACAAKDDYGLPPPPPAPDAAVDAANGIVDAAADAAVDAAVDASMHGADLEIAITAAPDPVNTSSTLTYTIDVTNHGGLDAANLKVTQRLPSGNVAFQSATGTGWTCSLAGQVVTCTRATLLLGPGPSITVKLTTPPTGGSIMTSASVSSDTPDPDMSNNDANATILVLTPADLAIAIADSPDPVAPQGTLSYTITVTNAGPGPATQIQVSDSLPSGLAFVSASGASWTCAAIGQDVTCQSMVLAMGASSVITLVATAPLSGGTVANTVQVTAATPDNNSANNQATASTTVTPAANLALSMIDSPDPVLANGTLQYAINVTNLGPDPASGITVTDSLPTSVAFQSATGSGWTCTQTGQTVTCTRPSLPAGAAPTIAITVRAPSDAAVLTNTARVTSTSSDLDASNNAATVATTVQPVADLSVAVTDAPDPVTAGTLLTYTVTASNAGPSQASNVTVTSTLPAGATFQDAIGNNWTCMASGQDITCTTPVMTVGVAPNITIRATAPDVGGVDGSIIENSSISSATLDPVSSNNTASQTTAVNAPADLALQLSASANPVPAQSRLTYTINVTNLGPRDAANVVVTNRLPDGNVVVVQNPSGNGWTCNTVGQLVTCTRPLLLVGAAPQIAFAITTPSVTATLVDQASVSAATSDRNLQNNSATNTTNVSESADLEINAVADQNPVEIGHNVTYTLTVSNHGPTSATAVQVVDTLPTGVTLVSADGPGWSCTSGQPVTCTIPSLGASSSASPISIVVTAPATAGNLTNTATVSSSASDPNSSNNTATVVTAASPFADLSIAVTDSVDPVQGTNQSGCTPNGCVIYSIDVQNAGPDAATGVVVDITLPAQGAFVDVTDTNHTWVCPAPSGGHLTCTRTGLAMGAAPTISLTWKAPSPGGFDIIVSATVSGSSHDPNTSNDSATQSTRVLP